MISIIVPFYNVEKWINKCLLSIQGQLYTDFEVILVDDGSTDRSADLAKCFVRKDKRFRLIQQENSGQVTARESGLVVARGEWISFVDSDDWIENDFLLEFVTKANLTDCDLVSASITHDYDDGRESDVLSDIYDEGYYQNFEDEILPNMIYSFEHKEMGLKCTLVNKLFRREKLIPVIGKIDPCIFYGEDAAVLYSYCMFCKTAYILHSAKYHYYIREASVCREVVNRDWKNNNYALFQCLKNSIESHRKSRILYMQLERYLLELETHALRKIYGVSADAFFDWDFSNYLPYLKYRVVIYGAGACGQALYHAACKSKQEKNVVLWVDKKSKEKNACYHIEPVEHIKKVTFDYVIIAIKNQELAKEASEELKKGFGIRANQIVREEIELRGF